MDHEDERHAICTQLDALSSALGGSWALLERTTDAIEVISPSDRFGASLVVGDYEAALRGIGPDGVVLRVGLGRRSHPSGSANGEERSGDRFQPGSYPCERILVGRDLADGAPDLRTAALLEVVLGSLSAVSEAALRRERDGRRAQRLEMSASTDPLTGLLNRRRWDRLLTVEEDRCARHHLSAEVVVVDLDGLKSVNDTNGHEAGDAIIVRAATFIFSAVRIHDSVARLGGDEFGVLGVGAAADSGHVAARIEQALAEAQVPASVGSAHRDEAGTLANAWRAADLRMYRVKQRRRRGSDARRAAPGSGEAARVAEDQTAVGRSLP